MRQSKHVSVFKERLQFQEDTGSGMRLENSFKRIIALGIEISPGGPGQIS